MAALYRAIPLSQIDNIAMLISHNLNLYIPGRLTKFFNIYISISKCSLRLILCGVEGIAETCRCMNKLHTPASPACSSFYDDWEANLPRNINCILLILYAAAAPGKNQHLQLFHLFFGLYLIPHKTHAIGTWAYKLDAAVFTYLRKFSILCKKTITRMYCLRIRNLSGAYNRRGV